MQVLTTTPSPPHRYAFEEIILEREVHNPQYRFLYEANSCENRYYRWKVVSLGTGARADAWDTAPLQLEVGGPRWIPPPCPRAPSARSPSRSPSRSPRRRSRSRSRSRSPAVATGGGGRQVSHEGSRESSPQRGRGGGLRGRSSPQRAPEEPRLDRNGERDLSERERDALEALLRGLTIEKSHIREAMGWCISRAAASDEIVETLAEALTLAKTPVPKKLARLFLLSDVLHNSFGTAPKASTFRSRCQAHLPSIFGSLRTAYMALESRMALEVMREQVTNVLHVWQAWSLFPPSMTAKLERIFLHGEGAAAAPAPATQSLEEEEEGIDGEPMVLDDEPGRAPSDAPCWAPPGASAAMNTVGSAVKVGAASCKGGGATAATDSAAGALSTLAAQETRARAFSLRELEAVCEASGLSTAGSRAEMLARLLAALRAGIPIALDAKPSEQQTLAVASRWDEDEDEEEGDKAGQATSAGAGLA